MLPLFTASSGSSWCKEKKTKKKKEKWNIPPLQLFGSSSFKTHFDSSSPLTRIVVRLKTTHPIYTYLFVCVVWWWCWWWCEETVWWVLAKQPAARLVLYYLLLFKKLFKSRFSNFIAHFRRVNISSSLHATTHTLLQLLTLFRGDWIFHFFTEKCIKTSLPFHHKITWCKFSMFFLSQADF